MSTFFANLRLAYGEVIRAFSLNPLLFLRFAFMATIAPLVAATWTAWELRDDLIHADRQRFEPGGNGYVDGSW